MSEEECNSQGSKVCSIGENSCTYEQRRINGVTYHSKGCKQANACLSNQYQNSGPFLYNSSCTDSYLNCLVTQAVAI